MVCNSTQKSLAYRQPGKIILGYDTYIINPYSYIDIWSTFASQKKEKLAAAGSHFLPGLPELWHLGVQSLGSACPRSLDSEMDQTRRPSEGGNGGESLHKGAEVFRVSEIW